MPPKTKPRRKNTKRKKVRGTSKHGSDKGWHAVAPKRGSQRQKLYAKYGAKCFLKPATLGYPICTLNGGGKPDCRGLSAAAARGRILGHKGVVRKALARKCKR